MGHNPTRPSSHQLIGDLLTLGVGIERGGHYAPVLLAIALGDTVTREELMYAIGPLMGVALSFSLLLQRCRSCRKG